MFDMSSCVTITNWSRLGEPALRRAASMFYVGQESCHHAEKRQIRTDAINERDSMLVGEAAEHSRSDAADAEGESEEQAGDGTDLAGHQFLREHDDGRECRGQYQSDDET